MLILNNFTHVHFIGCGGAGMFPLTAIMQQRGFKVSGSDLNSNEKTKKLVDLGVKIFTGHNANNLPLHDADNDKILIVYSSAVNDENIEYSTAKKNSLKMLRRGVFLGLLAKSYNNVITVSGSHGKTSITAMLVFLFNYFNIAASWVIGGEVVDGLSCFNTANDSEIFITEVDESDGTHTEIHSKIGLIPNIEDDHSWSVGGTQQLMKNFTQYAKQCDEIFTIKNKYPKDFWSNFQINITILKQITTEKIATDYGVPKELISHWGYYQMENALLAVNAIAKFGIDKKLAFQSLYDFSGIKRRAVNHFGDKNSQLQIIEDYAHHPTEVYSIISTLKRCYPDKELWVVFQPHRYARLEKYLQRFADELSHAHKVFVTPVFAAWVASNHVNHESLVNLITTDAETITANWNQEAQNIITALNYSSSKKILLILGAGDINKLLIEIKNIINN